MLLGNEKYFLQISIERKGVCAYLDATVQHGYSLLNDDFVNLRDV